MKNFMHGERSLQGVVVGAQGGIQQQIGEQDTAIAHLLNLAER